MAPIRAITAVNVVKFFVTEHFPDSFSFFVWKGGTCNIEHGIKLSIFY